MSNINAFPKTPSQALTGALEFFKVSVAEDIVTADAGVNGNKKLAVLINAISMFAQPVITGTIKSEAGYELTFAVEHAGKVVVADLQSVLEGTGEFATVAVEAVEL